MANELTNFEKISVNEFCIAEVRDRELPEVTGVRIRDAFCDNDVPTTERLAAKQAIAAALRRQVSSKDWPKDWPKDETKDEAQPKDEAEAKDEAKAREVISFAQAFAAAHALDDKRRPDLDSTAAAIDRRKALRQLQRRMDRQRGLRKEVKEEFSRQAGESTDFPGTFRVPGVPARVDNFVSMLTASVIRAGGKRPQHIHVADPDPWGTAESTASLASEKPGDDKRDDLLSGLLGLYAGQYASYTGLLWQVPALSLTAQAFLLTAALTSTNDKWARVLASVLSVLIAVASTRLMHDQRGHAMNHGELAFRVSKELRLAQRLGDLSVEDAKPSRANAETVWISWDHGIYAVWKGALYLFLIADIVVVILVLTKVK